MKSIYLSAALLGLAAGPAMAVTVLEYQTAPSQANPVLQPSAEASGVEGDPMAAGAGLTANNGGTWNWRGWNPSSASSADAVAANDVWTWGYDSATAYDLTAFDIRLDRSGTGPSEVSIELATDGGAFEEVLAITDLSARGETFLDIDLSRFDGVTDAAFRLSAWGSSSGRGTMDLESIGAYGFQLRGEEAAAPGVVPLPAGLPLLAVGLGVFGLVRRRG